MNKKNSCEGGEKMIPVSGKNVRSIFHVALVTLICFIGLPFSSNEAAVPKLMTYQGILKDSSGNFLTGTYSIAFRIYSASSGGSAVWTETQSSVSASSGKFSVSISSQEATIRIFNINGQEIYHQTMSDVGQANHQIDISSQAKGIYLIEVETKLGRSVQKIVVE